MSTDVLAPPAPQAMDPETTARYARCIEISKRVRWEIDRDVIRSRNFDFDRKFLPDGLTQLEHLRDFSTGEKYLLSQIQGRTYVNMFCMVERFINAKLLDVSREHWLGDQVALEALIRFSDEELKHQALFRRLEHLMAVGMEPGYQFVPEADPVAQLVLSKSTWAVLALTCHIELFTQTHYQRSIHVDPDLSELFKDVFLFHWKEESQHAVLDELEWLREDAKLTPAQRDASVNDLIELMRAIDGLLVLQSQSDVRYFVRLRGLRSPEQLAQLHAVMLKAYRWQYIVSGIEQPRFFQLLTGMLTEEQANRVTRALTPMIT
ncbi:hypothetical protein [Rhizobacter sp. OV335]|uniref:hypothetical protein n=1 Tax=Rhizobacter sp. OV335 TaxID=1500264 RepID=UPI000912BF57|nr:hypothetical protein [Rhizobacter sp. OV335]SHN28913.1 hypothetical protein SAMN02787076_04798 [Rhizobacter sp. OV335]